MFARRLYPVMGYVERKAIMIARYSVEDVEKVFGIRYTSEQKAALENMPFSEAVLKECEGTHMLFPGFPISLLKIRDRIPHLFYEENGEWYKYQPFAKNIQVRPSWHLLRMEPVPESFGKTRDEQRKLLLPDEDVPSAAAVAFATMLHFMMSRQRLFEHSFVCTADVDSGGFRVTVGVFDASGFGVSNAWVDSRNDWLGLSSVRFGN